MAIATIQRNLAIYHRNPWLKPLHIQFAVYINDLPLGVIEGETTYQALTSMKFWEDLSVLSWMEFDIRHLTSMKFSFFSTHCSLSVLKAFHSTMSGERVCSTCYGDMKNCIFKCHLSKFHNFGVINLLHCHKKIARDSPCWTPDTSLSTVCLLSKRKFQIGNLLAVLEGIMILCRCTRGHACCRRCCGKRSMLYLDDSTSWKIDEGCRNHSKDWKFWSVTRLLRCTFTPFAKLRKNEV